MVQWDADRYLQLSDNDHHTIVATRLVARVLPGFECRSGVLGHLVGRCLSHELGKDSRLGQPSSFCTSYFAWKKTGTARHLLQPRFCVDFCCEVRQFTSPFARAQGAVNGRRRTFVRSVETPCRAEMNCGREGSPCLCFPLSVPRGSSWLRKRSSDRWR